MSDLVARLVKRLREAKAVMFFDGWTSSIIHIEAADLIEQQAAKIVELEHLLSVMTSSRDGYAKQDAARLAEARRLALEEAITIVEAHDQDWPAETWIAGRIAVAIRSLKKGEQA